MRSKIFLIAIVIFLVCLLLEQLKRTKKEGLDKLSIGTYFEVVAEPDNLHDKDAVMLRIISSNYRSSDCFNFFYFCIEKESS